MSALAMCVLTMRMSDVPAALWEQNFAAWAVGTLLCVECERGRGALLTWRDGCLAVATPSALEVV